jgi:hypothetical protein
MTHRSESAQMLRACRHLLRHIDDARALATNDLTAPVFAEFCRDKSGGGKRRALMHIRELLRLAANDLVDGSADTAGRRRRDILLSCDLAGKPHKGVAAELGLSMRQFYRERQSLIAALSEILPERIRVRPPLQSSVVDVAALDLARARSLQYGGDFKLAESLLRSIVQDAQHPRMVIEAWSQLASLLLHQGDFSQCRAELHAIRSYVAQCRLDAHQLEVCGERVGLERRNLLECSGAIAEARAADRRALERIMGFLQSDDRDAREVAARALTAIARRDFICGDAAGAQQLLDQVSARNDIDTFAPDVQIHFFVLYAIMLCTVGHDRATASSLLSEAAMLCERYGFAELALITAIGRSIDEQLRGNASRALKQMRSVVPLARRIASPLNYVHVCLRIAELETPARPRMALAAIEEARRFISYRTVQWTYAELLSAEAFVRVKDFPAAKMHAEHAAAAAAEQQNYAVEGNALRILAECFAGMSAQHAAVDAIEAAIVRLERCGHPLQLLHAYRTAAKLTGRARYERSCEELAQLLHPA